VVGAGKRVEEQKEEEELVSEEESCGRPVESFAAEVEAPRQVVIAPRLLSEWGAGPLTNERSGQPRPCPQSIFWIIGNLQRPQSRRQI